MNNANKQTSKKLFLKKETLKQLSDQALSEVVGGGSKIVPNSAVRTSDSLN